MQNQNHMNLYVCFTNYAQQTIRMHMVPDTSMQINTNMSPYDFQQLGNTMKAYDLWRNSANNYMNEYDCFCNYANINMISYDFYYNHAKTKWFRMISDTIMQNIIWFRMFSATIMQKKTQYKVICFLHNYANNNMKPFDSWHIWVHDFWHNYRTHMKSYDVWHNYAKQMHMKPNRSWYTNAKTMWISKISDIVIQQTIRIHRSSVTVMQQTHYAIIWFLRQLYKSNTIWFHMISGTIMQTQHCEVIWFLIQLCNNHMNSHYFQYKKCAKHIWFIFWHKYANIHMKSYDFWHNYATTHNMTLCKNHLKSYGFWLCYGKSKIEFIWFQTQSCKTSIMNSNDVWHNYAKRQTIWIHMFSDTTMYKIQYEIIWLSIQLWKNNQNIWIHMMTDTIMPNKVNQYEFTWFLTQLCQHKPYEIIWLLTQLSKDQPFEIIWFLTQKCKTNTVWIHMISDTIVQKTQTIWIQMMSNGYAQQIWNPMDSDTIKQTYMNSYHVWYKLFKNMKIICFLTQLCNTSMNSFDFWHNFTNKNNMWIYMNSHTSVQKHKKNSYDFWQNSGSS